MKKNITAYRQTSRAAHDYNIRYRNHNHGDKKKEASRLACRGRKWA